MFLLYKGWKRGNTDADPEPTGYSRLCQLVTWASISTQPLLCCRLRTNMAPAPSALRRDFQGHMNPRILTANKQGLCLLWLLPETKPGHRERWSVWLVELQGTFRPCSLSNLAERTTGCISQPCEQQRAVPTLARGPDSHCLLRDGFLLGKKSSSTGFSCKLGGAQRLAYGCRSAHKGTNLQLINIQRPLCTTGTPPPFFRDKD